MLTKIHTTNKNISPFCKVILDFKLLKGRHEKLLDKNKDG